MSTPLPELVEHPLPLPGNAGSIPVRIIEIIDKKPSLVGKLGCLL